MSRRCCAVTVSLPMSALGSLPSGGLVLPSVASERPNVKGTAGPPMCSTATAPAYVYRSALLRPGNFFLRGSSAARAVARPALAPMPASGLKRMRHPLDPPDPSDLSNVPEQCHARRTKVGPMEVPSSRRASSSSMHFTMAAFTAAASTPEQSAGTELASTTAPATLVAAAAAARTLKASDLKVGEAKDRACSWRPARGAVRRTILRVAERIFDVMDCKVSKMTLILL
mmetsp:Transcript_58449/g.114845  ORF Transcript_58449/g.114845 Transcript_58449/m.114845 type:complete len:228 (-) Transcript_58449:50-733(-)